MDERVLAEPRKRRCQGLRDSNLPFIPGIDARRKTTEGNAQFDAVKYGDETEEPGRRCRRRCDQGSRGQCQEAGWRCGEHGQSYRDAVVETGGNGGRHLKGAARERVVRAQKDHARQTPRFLIFGFEVEKDWTSRRAGHVGSRNLDTVHTGGPLLVESTYS